MQADAGLGPVCLAYLGVSKSIGYENMQRPFVLNKNKHLYVPGGEISGFKLVRHGL